MKSGWLASVSTSDIQDFMTSSNTPSLLFQSTEADL
jgi:hypothetical protein